MVSVAQAYPIALRYHQTGQVHEAATVYRQILQAEPGNAHVCYLLGAACQTLGQLDEAAVHLEQSLQLRPGFAAAHNHLGVVRVLQGNLAAATACFEEALRLNPDYTEARENLAKAVQASVWSQGTAMVFAGVPPRSAEDWSNEGIRLVSQGRVEEAISSFREAVLLNPDHAEAHRNLGNLLRKQGRCDEAIVHLGRAIQLQPDGYKAHLNLGSALWVKGHVEEATASYQQAVRLNPDSAVAHLNLGVALAASGRMEEALHSYDEATWLKPDHAEAHKNRAIAWLLQGDFARGWPEYRWRWRCPDFSPPNYPQPGWDGTPLQGRTILLYAEQGLGDTLQFIRYVPLVRRGGGRVMVLCPRPLHRLLRRGPSIDHLLDTGEVPPPFDVHAPLLSLPDLLGTTLTTIPAEVPYLWTDDSLVERWRREVSALSGFKIGIAWQGNPQHKDDRSRSVPLRAFAPLAAVRGVRLVSLQTGPETEQLRRLPADWTVLDAGSRVEDWADTAGLIKNLNLVVTVDTAVAHLAGALGVPVWVALPFAPDWRWLLEREDSPWYPSMRLFRQPQRGNWTDVFARIATAASTLLERAGP